MGAAAAAEGKVIDIAVFGESCLVLVSDIRAGTRDVDAVILAEADLAYRLADSAGAQLGLPAGWLNQAVKLYVGTAGNPKPSLFPVGEYPKDGPVGLRAFVPTPEYILAMKLIANRGAVEDAARDRNDMLALMKICGLREKAALLNLVRVCYPSVPAIAARLEARIDDLLRALAADLEDGEKKEHEPTWHAGRGRPTRP